MSSVDSRIVSMKFDNSRFERGVATTLGTLSKLKSALSFGKSKQNIADLQGAANKFNMDGMQRSVSTASAGFVALATVAITALSNIANRAVDTGLSLTKSLTIDPIMDGFREYETNMNSIQTVLSNTSKDGTKLKDVNAALDELNTYADKTIYNFSEMTRNIGTFTAAGVNLETSTSAIKGIANLAAMSGSNSQQASTAMYQLSQAMASGTVKLMDWNSVVNAGMGGEVFQEALFESGKAMKTLADVPMSMTFDEWKDAGNSFRGSLEEGWITGEVLTNTLQGFTGDLTDAQLKSMGYNEEQIKSIQKMGKMGMDAATKVKTMTQLIDTLREGVGSGWAKTWQIVFGDFNEAKGLFTGVSEALGGFIGKSADARNKVLGDWKKLGGRTILIEAIGNAFNNLLDILSPIKKAFRDVFPRTTGQQLYQMTVWLRNLTKEFKMGGETGKNLRKTFRGIFSILSIGWQVIKGVLGLFGNLFGMFFKGSGGILEVTGSIGDFFYNLDQGLKKNQTIKSFFDNIFEAFEKIAVGISNAIKGIADFIDSLNLFDKGSKAFGLFADTFVGFFEGFGKILGKAFSSGNFKPVLDFISVGLLGAITLGIKKFTKEITGFSIGDSLFGGINETFEQLTGTLKAMQTQLQAKTLMSIAIAVGVLAASIFVLSTIDGPSLARALTAMAVGFGQLVVVMGIMMKLGGALAFISQFSLMALGLIALATAMLILSAAIKVLSTMSWEELAKGLVGLAGALTIMAVASRFLSKGAVGFLIASVGIVAISVALNLLAVAMLTFGSMNMGEIAKGLIAIGGALAIIAFGVKMMPKSLILIAPALVAIGVALNLIATALLVFGGMDIVTMVTGLASMGGALAIIAVAMKAMPKTMLITGAGLLVVAGAMNVLAIAMQIFGHMDLAEIGKSFLAMAGALVILSVGLSAMSGSVFGAAALLLAAVAISALVPPLVALGQLKLKHIGAALLALAGAFLVLGVAAYAINFAAATIVVLGAGVLLLGVGMVAAGAGVLLFAKGLKILFDIISAGQGKITDLIMSVVKLLPKIFGAMAEALVEFGKAFVKNLPKFMEMIGKFFVAVLDKIIEIIPKIVEVVNRLVTALLVFLSTKVPAFITVGFQLLTAFMTGLAQNIAQLTLLGANLIIKFLGALNAYLPRLITAGVTLMVNFMTGIASNMFRLIAAGTRVILKFLAGVATVMPRIIEAGSKIILQFMLGVGQHIARVITLGTRIIVKLLEGIGNSMARIVTAGTNVIIKMMNAIGRNLWRVIDKGSEIIVKLLRGISNRMQRVIDAGTRVVTKFISAIGRSMWKVINTGSTIILKILEGLGRKMPRIVTAGANVIIKILNAIARKMPQVINAGANVIVAFLKGLERELPRITRQAAKTLVAFINGLADAINDNQAKLNQASERLAKAIINGMIWGLKWNAGKVGTAAINVANAALKGAMRWLGIKSPSRVFRDKVGKQISAGMAVGISANGQMVEDSSKGVAKSALDVARETLSKLGRDLGGDVDMTPTISPILDLSNVRKDAKLIGGLVGSGAITTDTSYSGATAVLQSRRATQEAARETLTPTEREIKFVQNNYSPKALSDIEIYRQTKNQLSAAKGALKE